MQKKKINKMILAWSAYNVWLQYLSFWIYAYT